jgi:DNA-binding MarR family transcriptional regulator
LALVDDQWWSVAKAAPAATAADRGRDCVERKGAPVSAPASPAAQVEADLESRVHDDHHETLRLWLRLLTCTLTIEGRVRTRLRERFATTLPRFDLMAQLERNPKGLKMGELSRRLMVTGGNVTGITDQLVTEGLVRREPIAGDRRAHAVRLTPKGKQAFDAMAVEHEGWVEELLSGLTRAERARLYTLLGRLKATIQQRAEPPQARMVPSRREGAQRQGSAVERDAVAAGATREKTA